MESVFIIIITIIVCSHVSFFHLLSSVDVVFPLFFKCDFLSWQYSNSSSLRNERTKDQHMEESYVWLYCKEQFSITVRSRVWSSLCETDPFDHNSQLGIFVLQGVLENMLNVYFIYIYTVSRQFYPKQLANWNKSNYFVNKIRNMSQVY